MKTVKRHPTILIIDDDEEYVKDLSAFLSGRYELASARYAEEAIGRIQGYSPAAVLLDIDLGGGADGFEVLKRIQGMPDPPPVLMLTADASIGSVVKAIRMGAFHYVSKDQGLEELVSIIDLGLSDAALRRKIRVLESDVERIYGTDIVAVDDKSRRLLEEVEKVARARTPVLITGESGTGKEVLARYIHRISGRANGPFIAINCAAISPQLIESELFGHEKGAFTGAIRQSSGKFTLADQGTLFLDEIGHSPLDFQVKLLRVIEESVFYRVGGETPLSADVRILAATSRDLQEAIADGRFREELFHRLHVFPIHIPPLRERPGDIIPLAQHFLGKQNRELRKEIRGFTPEAVKELLDHSWRGNVRDLRNMIERAAIQCEGDLIRLADLLYEPRYVASPPPYDQAKTIAMNEFKQRYLSMQLRWARGNVSAAADRSGIKRPSFHRMVKECGIRPEEFRGRR